MTEQPLPSPDDVKVPKNYKEHFKVSEEAKYGTYTESKLLGSQDGHHEVRRVSCRTTTSDGIDMKV